MGCIRQFNLFENNVFENIEGKKLFFFLCFCFCFFLTLLPTFRGRKIELFFFFDKTEFKHSILRFHKKNFWNSLKVPEFFRKTYFHVKINKSKVS